MSEVDRELRHLNLRSLVLGTRVPSLVFGLLVMVGGLATGGFAVVGWWEEGLEGMGAFLQAILSSTLFLLPAGFLLFSSVQGFRGRAVSQARALAWVWRLFAVYLLGLSLMGSFIFFMMMLGGLAFVGGF